MSIKMYFAEVRDIENDPTRSGRVKVRIYNHQNDERAIPDEDLPWALPLQPTTSAAFNGIGISPHGLLVGSRVLVGFTQEDKSEQYPIIFGSFSRAMAPPVEGVQNNPDPLTGGVSGKLAPDHPAGSGPSNS
jgi:hypothetical protein